MTNERQTNNSKQKGFCKSFLEGLTWGAFARGWQPDNRRDEAGVVTGTYCSTIVLAGLMTYLVASELGRDMGRYASDQKVPVRTQLVPY